MTPWLFLTASAQPPQLEALALVAAGDATRAVPNLAGIAGGVGLRRSALEGAIRLRGGVTARPSPALALEPTVRLWLSPPELGGLAVRLGGGLELEDRLYASLSPGLTLDLGPSDRLRPRIDATYHLRAASDQRRLSLSLGLAWGPTPTPTPKPTLQLPTDPDVMLWVPRPVCAWREPAEVLEAAGAPLPQILLDDRGPRPFDPDGTTAPDPFDGELVIAAWPGDRILLDGQLIEADADGLAIVPRPRGEATVEVIGGGRIERHAIAVGQAHVLWLSAEPPSPIHVQFGLGSGQLTSEALQQIEEIAEAAGGWRFEIRGGHSPEGDPQHNEALARARSAAVAGALAEAGIPLDAIELVEELAILGADTPPEALRAAIIYPMEPEIQ